MQEQGTLFSDPPEPLATQRWAEGMEMLAPGASAQVSALFPAVWFPRSPPGPRQVPGPMGMGQEVYLSGGGALGPCGEEGLQEGPGILTLGGCHVRLKVHGRAGP